MESVAEYLSSKTIDLTSSLILLSRACAALDLSLIVSSLGGMSPISSIRFTGFMNPVS